MSEVKGKKATGKKVSQKKKRQRKIVLLAVEIFILIVLAIVAFLVLKFSKVVSNIEPDAGFEPEKIEVNEDISSETKEIMKGYRTIVMFGLDNRSNGRLDRGNSDVIMIAAINKDTGEVKLASVYRDTYLDIGGGTFKKCNAAYAAGGAEQAINMLNRNFDLEITDYVTVDFNSIVECVDLLGGVEVTVTDDEAILMKGYMEEIAKLTKKESENQLLPGAGTYNMNGVQACAFARIRYTTGDDYKRTERQRTVLTAMINKAKANPSKITSLLEQVSKDIKTGFSPTDLISLATEALSSGYSLGEQTGFPFEKNTRNLGKKGDVVVPCDLESNVITLHQFLYNDSDYTPSETVRNNSAKIINDTGYHQGDGF